MSDVEQLTEKEKKALDQRLANLMFKAAVQRSYQSGKVMNNLRARRASLASGSGVPQLRAFIKPGRNDRCPCESGEKAKRCCWKGL